MIFVTLSDVLLPFQVLKNEFSKGIDIIYESVGGEMFDTCLNALATYGHLVVIGMISQVRGYTFMFISYLLFCKSLISVARSCCKQFQEAFIVVPNTLFPIL